MFAKALASFILVAVVAIDVAEGARRTYYVQGKHSEQHSSTTDYSIAAAATLLNISQQIAQFQKMVVTHSTHFEQVLQQQEKDNAAVQSASALIDAGNKKLEAKDKALEKQAKALIAKNKQLRTELTGLERKRSIAKAMADAVNSFKAAGDEKDEKGSDVNDEKILGLHHKASLLVVSSRTTRAQLSKGVQDFMHEEANEVATLQKTFDGALADGKKRHAQLLDEQHQHNATRTSLEGRISTVTSMIARLTAEHNRLEARVQSLGTLFNRLAAIASGGHAVEVKKETTPAKAAAKISHAFLQLTPPF